LGEDLGLNASFDTSDPISHGVHAGHFGIRSRVIFKCIFASSQFVFPELAAWLAEFDEHFLRVLTPLNHGFGGRRVVVTVFIGSGSDVGRLRHFKTGINFNLP